MCTCMRTQLFIYTWMCTAQPRKDTCYLWKEKQDTRNKGNSYTLLSWRRRKKLLTSKSVNIPKTITKILISKHSLLFVTYWEVNTMKQNSLWGSYWSSMSKRIFWEGQEQWRKKAMIRQKGQQVTAGQLFPTPHGMVLWVISEGGLQEVLH